MGNWIKLAALLVVVCPGGSVCRRVAGRAEGTGGGCSGVEDDAAGVAEATARQASRDATVSGLGGGFEEEKEARCRSRHRWWRPCRMLLRCHRDNDRTGPGIGSEAVKCVGQTADTIQPKVISLLRIEASV